jgi:hypothetical protein
MKVRLQLIFGLVKRFENIMWQIVLLSRDIVEGLATLFDMMVIQLFNGHYGVLDISHISSVFKRM